MPTQSSRAGSRRACRRLTGGALALLAATSLATSGAFAAPAAAGSTGTAATATLAASTAGQAVVDRLHAALLDAMKNAEETPYQQRYEALAPVLTESFDLDYMARKSVGRGWKSLSEEEQKLWLETFARMIIANYAGQFDQYTGEHFETLGEDPSIKQTVMVRTRLVVPDEEDVELNYRMRAGADGWRIIDVYMNGTVSELALRRSEYTDVLKKKGFDELVSLMNAKVTKLGED